MRWSRKGVVIRLLIYGPLIGYLGYHAAIKWRAEHQDPEPTAPAPDKLAPYKRVIEMPDGTKQEVVELTEQQAHDLLGLPAPTEDPPAAQ